MEIEHMSVSRKSTCDQCDQLYKYQYHLKLKSLEPEPFYFVYGKIVHKIAEEYVLQRGSRQLYEIVSDVLGGKIPIERGEKDVFAPSIPADYKKRMPEHLDSIKKITEKIGFEGYLEYPFYEDLEAPNKKNVKGFIDRLYQKGDLWYIIDYKTTKPGKYRKNNQTNCELILGLFKSISTFLLKTSGLLCIISKVPILWEPNSHKPPLIEHRKSF